MHIIAIHGAIMFFRELIMYNDYNCNNKGTAKRGVRGDGILSTSAKTLSKSSLTLSDQCRLETGSDSYWSSQCPRVSRRLQLASSPA